MAIDSTSPSGKKYKPSRQYRLLVKQNKLLDELLMKQYQLCDQLLVKQFKLNLLLLQQCKSMFPSGGAAAPAAPAPAAGTASEGNVDNLVAELLAEEDGFIQSGAGEASEDSDALSPGTLGKAASAPVAGRSASQKVPAQEKATPAPKPKLKPKQDDDEDAALAVPIKYWVTLASLGLILAVYLSWSYFGGPLSEKALAQRALSAGTKEERLLATDELRGRQATADLRRVAAESKDAEVLTLALNYLWGASDGASVPVYYAAMKHEDKGVREAGLRGAQKLYGEILPGKIEYQVDAPPEEREQAVSKLLDFYKNPPKMPMGK